MNARFADAAYLGGGLLGTFTVGGSGGKSEFRVFCGTKFDLLGTGLFSRVDLIRNRVDKDTDEDPCSF